ncbi:MAG: hypothetical protein PF961_12660 [Planctomycetota bacterium]|jgi:hypothetical protein|nr:hypothetical protein [Planctomycetota bacterium]
MDPAESQQDAPKKSSVIKRLVLVVVALGLAYFGLFAAWRWHLTSADELAQEYGSGEGLPDWVDGGNTLLWVDHDSLVDTAGAWAFAPLIACEERWCAVQYVHEADLQFWQ